MAQLMSVQVPTPTPSTDWPGNLRDVIDTQQQTIKFLLGQWNELLGQVTLGGGEFGNVTDFAVNAVVPAGWWVVVAPATGTIATADVHGVTVNVVAPSQFWSDGNTKVTGTGVKLARVAVIPEG